MYVAMDTQQRLSILQSVRESDITSFTCWWLHITSVCFWKPIWEVVCLWAVPRCNLWTCTPTPVYHWLIWQLEFTNLDQFRLSVDSAAGELVGGPAPLWSGVLVPLWSGGQWVHSDVSFDSGPYEAIWMMNWWWAASLHDFSAWG